MRRILISALAALSLVGCGLHHHSHSSSAGLGETQAASFSSTLTSDRSIYLPRQIVTFTLTVTNLTDQPRIITDPQMDWRIANGNGDIVAQNTVPGAAETFAPREAKTFSYTWDQSIGVGIYATGGEFTATAWLGASPTPELTGSCQVLVIPPPPPPSDG
jgi:hypothetical protein